MAMALLVHGPVQFGDGLVAVERFGRHWLHARHRGRAALVSTHGDARSCRMAKKLAAVHGHARLDWVMLLDPVATDVMACWQALAHRVEAPQQGLSPIAHWAGAAEHVLGGATPAPALWSHGVAGWESALATVSQALWPLQEQQRSEHQPAITGTWLGFKPSALQRRWLPQHGVGARFIGL